MIDISDFLEWMSGAGQRRQPDEVRNVTANETTPERRNRRPARRFASTGKYLYFDLVSVESPVFKLSLCTLVVRLFLFFLFLEFALRGLKKQERDLNL